MLNKYLKIGIRNIIKSKTNSMISILGLGIGLAVCFLLLLYVQHELSYDRFHDKADHIYRLCWKNHPFQPPQTAGIMADKIPEIKDYTRILVRGRPVLQYKEKKFIEKEEYAFADPSLFRIFSFKFKYGNSETALDKPFSIVVSEKIAKKYFGDKNPIGKVLRLDNESDFTVTAVIENMPQNSHFRYDVIVTLANDEELFGDWVNNWGWKNFIVYFYMQDDFSKEDVEIKCSEAMRNPNDPDAPLPEYDLQKLKDIHLYSTHFEADIQPQNSITYVIVFSAIGILILLIACFNYINLLTANATTRAKEIGVKKVTGATRKQLAIQFLAESLIMLFIALLLSFIIIEIGLPIFNNLSGKSLSFSTFIQPQTLLGIIIIVLATGILAGCYPAFVLAAFQPVKVLKSSAKVDKSKFNSRKIIIGIQFTIVIILVCCALFMLRQINHLRNKELGFDKEYIITSEVTNPFNDIEKFNSLKEELFKHGIVNNVTAASRIPSGDLNNWGALVPELQSNPEWINLPFVHVQHNYLQTLGIKALQGRILLEEYSTDINDAIVLNEAAVKHLGIKGNPVGQSVKCSWPESDRKIIGIVNDFHFESLYEKIRPVAFLIEPDECYQLMVKMNPSNVKSSVNTIREVCQKFYPNELFEFRFLDVNLEQNYQKDNKTFKLMGHFTVLAIFIACMGLFGLAIFTMNRRTKEIGIRKVFGEPLINTLIVLIKDFIIWIVIANLIAIPVSWHAMNKWLQNFAYHVNLSWWVFIIAGCIAIIIALLTVSWHSWLVARKNPIDALRYE